MFDIHIAGDGVVKLSGRLDAAESNRALGVLRTLDRAATVDFSELDYISSAGISALIETHKRLHGAGHELKLIRLKPRVRNVFAYAGLDRLLDIE